MRSLSKQTPVSIPLQKKKEKNSCEYSIIDLEAHKKKKKKKNLKNEIYLFFGYEVYISNPNLFVIF